MILFTSNLDGIVPIIVIVIAAVSVLTLGLLIAVFILQNIVSGYFSSKKFAVKSKHKVEPLTGEEKFELMVFNNNVNEARILSFGFLYRSNSVDFFDTFIEKELLPKDTKVIITSRDFIKLEIEAKHLQDIIRKHNDGKVRVDPVYAYVTDIGGNIIKYPAREVRRIVYRHFKAIDDERKATEKSAKQEATRIKREAAQAARTKAWSEFTDKLAKKPKAEPKPEPKPEKEAPKADEKQAE